MKLRYYLRGLGIGMLVTAMILVLAPGEKETLSDEEIKARAVQLGMIESSSLTLAEMQNMQGSQAAENQSSSQESQTTENQNTSQETQASESQSPSQESESQSPSQESQASESQSSSQESQTAESQSPSQESQESESQSPSQESQAAESQSPSQESQAAESQSPSQESQANESQNPSQESQTSVGVQTSGPKVEDGVEIIEITIPGGSSSGAVSRQLANAGLVEDAKEYDNYLCNNGYSRRIRVGTFKIPVGAGWQEIADIISTK